MARRCFLALYAFTYRWLIRPVIFRMSAQAAHDRMLTLLRWADGQGWLVALFSWLNRFVVPKQSLEVGGVMLTSPLILAAGLIKGDGFASEEQALAAADRRNIIPGWRGLSHLAAPVEFGSYTRWPRLGNSGTVVWRDVPSQSTQNRVGLCNPGSLAAAVFLAAHRDRLPAQYGINIAVSPGVSAPDDQAREVTESLAAFVERQVFPAWFTLNLSCPNTEDDPGGHQTAEQARIVCGAAAAYLYAAAAQAGRDLPLWVKIGPTLAGDQYRALMQVFEEIGVRAVIATNTLPRLMPSDALQTAGVGGGDLHKRTLAVVADLMQEKEKHGYRLDVIACGGVQDRYTLADFARLDVQVMQYWTALVYRGPLAAALILREADSSVRNR
ncbi:MAG: hypothetical protein JW966_12265 [Anaerolineae bacterium]|nr:hypothetical protein [Anaerolineae bacterium]